MELKPGAYSLIYFKRLFIGPDKLQAKKREANVSSNKIKELVQGIPFNVELDSSSFFNFEFRLSNINDTSNSIGAIISHLSVKKVKLDRNLISFVYGANIFYISIRHSNYCKRHVTVFSSGVTPFSKIFGGFLKYDSGFIEVDFDEDENTYSNYDKHFIKFNPRYLKLPKIYNIGNRNLNWISSILEMNPSIVSLEIDFDRYIDILSLCTHLNKHKNLKYLYINFFIPVHTKNDVLEVKSKIEALAFKVRKEHILKGLFVYINVITPDSCAMEICLNLKMVQYFIICKYSKVSPLKKLSKYIIQYVGKFFYDFQNRPIKIFN
jgi:hypothetical protein